VNARRSIPLSTRAEALLQMRQLAATSEWVFPAPTKSGHIEQSTLRRQHEKACTVAGLNHFPFYTFRHTCLTRWSQCMDPYTLAYFAGHGDFSTTRRYVHPNMESARAAIERAGAASGGHSSGHTGEMAKSAQSERETVLQ
jgi:integrase